MNGQDKGLVVYQGRPLAEWVLQALAPQSAHMMISANRHLSQYQALLSNWRPAGANDTAPSQRVWPDDADLPPGSGPLAGIVTALRHCTTDWLLVAPCDTPHLPLNLVSLLYEEAQRSRADVVVPKTRAKDHLEHLHWVCALIRKGVCPQTEALFVKGERKAGLWVQSCRWSSVSFADEAAFTNMNTLETLHGRA